MIFGLQQVEAWLNEYPGKIVFAVKVGASGSTEKTKGKLAEE
jgi:hypothetical protein